MNTFSKRRPLRARNLIPFALVGVLLVASVLVAVLTAGSPSDASTLVRNALLSSVQADSAQISLSENVTGATNVVVDVSGACSFASVTCTLSEDFGGALSELGSANEELANGTAYVEFTNSLFTLPTPWVSVPLDLSGVASPLGGGSPLSALALVAQLGGTVTDDGVVTKDGQSLHEYTVSVSAAQVTHQLGDVLKSLPSWMQQALTSTSTSINTYQAEVYINSNNQVAEVDTNASLSLDAATTNVASTLTISNYGAPVNVTIPPASEVTSLSSLASML